MNAIRAIVIPVDGPLRVEMIAGDRLHHLQGVVGGLIEAVNLSEVLTDTGRRRVACTVFVNEEGKLLGLPVNPRATDLCAIKIGGWFLDVIVGDVVVVGWPDDQGGETSCPPEVERIITEWGWPVVDVA